MTHLLEVTFAEGKYTVIQEEGGGMRFLSHGSPWPAADRDWTYAGMILALAYELEGARATIDGIRLGLTPIPPAAEPERVANDGTVRKAYYGAYRQPWDDIVEQGWDAACAASMVLKYLRRDKGERSKDLEKARWYYARLCERCDRGSAYYDSTRGRLLKLLDAGELAHLHPEVA